MCGLHPLYEGKLRKPAFAVERDRTLLLAVSQQERPGRGTDRRPLVTRAATEFAGRLLVPYCRSGLVLPKTSSQMAAVSSIDCARMRARWWSSCSHMK